MKTFLKVVVVALLVPSLVWGAMFYASVTVGFIQGIQLGLKEKAAKKEATTPL